MSIRKTGLYMVLGGWLGLILLMTYLFQSWIATQDNPNENLETSIKSGGVREVVLVQNRHHHYVLPGRINGKKVKFLLDTGATNVSVPGEIATDLGLKRGFPMTTITANGKAKVFATVIDSLEIGEIKLRDVRGNINPNMGGREVLLGMSALKDIELIQKDRKLILRQMIN